jgi:hypothetical protein
MDASFDFVPVLIFIVIGSIALALIASYFVIAARRRAWSNLADQAALTLSTGNFLGRGLSISGTYHSHPLTLDTYTRGSGKYSHTYTRILVGLNHPTDLSLSIHNEGVFSKIGKALGQKEIQIGDEAIDQRYIIKGQPETTIASILLSYDLRQKLIEAPSFNARIQGLDIYYDRRGVELDENKLIALFDLLTSLANAIDRVQIS